MTVTDYCYPSHTDKETRIMKRGPCHSKYMDTQTTIMNSPDSEAVALRTFQELIVGVHACLSSKQPCLNDIRLQPPISLPPISPLLIFLIVAYIFAIHCCCWYMILLHHSHCNDACRWYRTGWLAEEAHATMPLVTSNCLARICIAWPCPSWTDPPASWTQSIPAA